jgi:two-component system sensor histidine kinase NreB
MAEERQDERMQIASYLHDDLAQSLFRLSLQIDLADRYLVKGDSSASRKVLMEMKETKNETADRIRSMIRDLHRSPLGRAGLAEAIRSFTNEVGVAGPAFEIKVEDLPLAPSIQLLAYQIAREAIMNSLKYADASHITVVFGVKGESVELMISDDGTGFDASAGEPEGHFGLTMMKERAQIAGGSLDLVSARGHGTVVTARFPSTWLNPERTALSEVSPGHQPASMPLLPRSKAPADRSPPVEDGARPGVAVSAKDSAN